MERLRSPRPTSLVILAVAVVPIVAACDLLNTPGGEPEEVTVRIESVDVGEVNVVTSTNFLLIPDPECPEDCPESVQLIGADTINPTLPFDRTYGFTSQLQFFVEAFLAPDQAATLSMKVTIDDRVWYDDFRTLSPTAPGEDPETIRFVYRYSEGGVY